MKMNELSDEIAATTFRVVELNSLDPDGEDGRNEPRLSYPDALVAARELQLQGKAYRVLFQGAMTEESKQAFLRLGALV